ncbi:MAG: hypothetical protein R6W77_01055 [Trueperaceae bacterium]
MIEHPDPETRQLEARGDLPSTLTLTVFFPSGSCSDADVASGKAYRRAARALLMRIVREHALLRHARTAGVRLRFGAPVLGGKEPRARFDHVVGRLDGSVARGEPGRFRADFFRGVDAVGTVSIAVHTRTSPASVV